MHSERQEQSPCRLPPCPLLDTVHLASGLVLTTGSPNGNPEIGASDHSSTWALGYHIRCNSRRYRARTDARVFPSPSTGQEFIQQDEHNLPAPHGLYSWNWTCDRRYRSGDPRNVIHADEYSSHHPTATYDPER